MINLFIYIPTYRRPIALSKQLDTLLPQVRKFPNHVRIVVRDNDSKGPQFEAIKKKYQADNILFEKNFGNIGGNANIALGFVFARENEFLWILSDNDLVRDDCIAYLLDEIDNTIDYVVMNDQVTYPKKVYWSWADGWLEPINWWQGLISAALFNTNTVRESIGDGFFYHNSSFPHLAVACSAAKKNEKVTFMHLPFSSVHQEVLTSQESITDYSLSHVGMPGLLALFPVRAGRIFARQWAHKNGWMFYLNREKHPELFASSKYLLVKLGGAIIYFYLFKAKLLCILSNRLDWISDFLRIKKCTSNLVFLKKISKWVGFR